MYKNLICVSPEQKSNNYSIAYFEHITKFDMLQPSASGKGGAHMHFIDTSDIHAFTIAYEPVLSRSSVLQRVKPCDLLQKRDRIIFDFYPGLPITLFLNSLCTTISIDIYMCVTDCIHILTFANHPNLKCVFHTIIEYILSAQSGNVKIK